MRGHVARKGNRYYAVVYEGLDPATGKERHRWYAGGSTRKAAERLLTELVKRHHDGEYRPPVRITLGEYLVERWLPIKRAQVQPTTFEGYQRTIANHVVPRIGAIPIQRLSAEDLDGLYAGLLTDGACRREGGLSVKTVRNVHAILHKALADAHRKGTVTRNVADLSDPPKLSSVPRPEMRVWTAEQLRRFLDEISEHRLHAAFHLAANTGMRRGEVLGLRLVRRRPRRGPAVGAPGGRARQLRDPCHRREDRDRPAGDRPRRPDRLGAAGVAGTPARGAAGVRGTAGP